MHSNRAAIRRVVESHRARNARVFGSVLHGRDTDRSDLDILIDPTPKTTLFDIGAIRLDLPGLRKQVQQALAALQQEGSAAQP